MAHNPEARERAAAATRRYRETPHGKAREREYYLAHKAEYRRREREYAKRQDVRERMARKQAAYRERNALKECARREVARALRDGSLCIPAMCEWCHKPASDERLEAHHWRGYEAHHWLDVKFVHAACHDVCESIPPDHWM